METGTKILLMQRTASRIKDSPAGLEMLTICTV